MDTLHLLAPGKHDKAQVQQAAGKKQDGKALCTVLEGRRWLLLT